MKMETLKPKIAGIEYVREYFFLSTVSELLMRMTEKDGKQATRGYNSVGGGQRRTTATTLPFYTPTQANTNTYLQSS